MPVLGERNAGDALPLVGRDGLLRTITWRLGRNESLALYGGPQLGKTSCLMELKQRLDGDMMKSRYLDLANPKDRDALLADVPDLPSPIDLLDNCDALCEGGGPIPDFANRWPGWRGVLAGGRRWHDTMAGREWGSGLRRMPLAVLLDKDARHLLRASRLGEPGESILGLAGTHPYVLNVMCRRTRDVAADTDVAMIWSQVCETLAPFFADLVQQLKSPIEHALLEYLVRLARPVNPRTAAVALGQTTLKPVVDVLCWLGAISRCIRNDEATLFANSLLFNRWYVDHVTGT